MWKFVKTRMYCTNRYCCKPQHDVLLFSIWPIPCCLSFTLPPPEGYAFKDFWTLKFFSLESLDSNYFLGSMCTSPWFPVAYSAKISGAQPSCCPLSAHKFVLIVSSVQEIAVKGSRPIHAISSQVQLKTSILQI